ncbi:MAG: AAA family ATPase [Gallionella sp.]|jgi:hypothetical protein
MTVRRNSRKRVHVEDEEIEEKPVVVVKRRRGQRKPVVVESPVEMDEVDEDEADEDEAEVDEDEVEPLDLKQAISAYFKADNSKLKALLAKELVKAFKLPLSELDPILDQTLEQFPLLTDEYSQAQPADQTWKIDLNENLVRRLEPTLISLRDELALDKPTMVKILSAHLPQEDKKRALALFDVLANIEPFTEDHVRVSDYIANILKRSAKTHLEMVELEASEKVLKGIAPVTGYLERIVALKASTETKARIYERYQSFKELSAEGRDYESQKAWLDHALALPYDQETTTVLPTTPKEINALCVKIRQKLDEKVYGLDKIKQEVINAVVNRLTNPNGKSHRNLALQGMPGVGKSLILSSVAEAMGLPFECISLGGSGDASQLKGHSSTYIGSEPGLMVKILQRIKSSRGIILFDEVDKLSQTAQGREVQYALLHLSDKTLNHSFRDNYLSELKIDLSNMWFVFAMNNEEWLDKALKDRLQLFHIKMYSKEEKEIIVRRFLLPEALKEVGMGADDISLTDGALTAFVKRVGLSEGIRPLKDGILSMVSRVNLYRSVLLGDGTTGEVKLDYKIKGFKLPLVLTEELVKVLYVVEKGGEEEENCESKRMMYM